MELDQIALAIHVPTALLLVLTVIYTDHLGFSWMRGTATTIPQKRLRFLHHIVWVGLIVMALTGTTMFIEYQDYLLGVPAFYAKMAFVATLLVNAFFIGKLMHVASERPFASLTQEERLPLYISGAVSTIAWIGTITCAFMLGL